MRQGSVRGGIGINGIMFALHTAHHLGRADHFHHINVPGLKMKAQACTVGIGSFDPYPQKFPLTGVGYADLPWQPPPVVWHDLGRDDLYFSLEDCSPDLRVGTDLRLRNHESTVTAHVTKVFNGNLARIVKQQGGLPSHEA